MGAEPCGPLGILAKMLPLTGTTSAFYRDLICHSLCYTVFYDFN